MSLAHNGATHPGCRRALRSRGHGARVPVVLLVLACLATQPAWAADAAQPSPDSAILLLQKIQAAARQLDYAGIFTYQQGATLQSTRIVHIVDGTGERERLEMLDGLPREFIRHNDTVQCLVPEKKVIIMERRRGDRFPGVLIGDGKNIPAYYSARQAQAPSRIAGRECMMLDLVPKDEHRYGYRFCTDTQTGLLLKAQILGAQRNVIDQIAFSSLMLGEKVSADQLAPSWNTKGWNVLEAPVQSVDLARTGWRIPSPPGFERMTQVSLPMKAGRHVSQLVFSDGLAAISVFIEPFDDAHGQAPPQGAVRKGAMNIFGARIGNHRLTAIGEVPVATLRDIAERTESVPLVAPQQQ